MTDKIIFVSPVLNEEKRIGLLIDSLKKQTNPNWLLIIVDNASNDFTCSMVITKASLDPRIILIENQSREINIRNSWIRAINYVLENYRESFIQIIPGDDFVASHDFVSRTLEIFTRRNIVAVLPLFKYLDKEVHFTSISRLELARKWTYVHSIFGIYRYEHFKSAIRKFEAINYEGASFDWWLSYFLFTKRAIFDKSISIFRDSETSISYDSSPSPLRIISSTIKQIYSNLQHFVLIGRGFTCIDRLILGFLFILITTIEIAKFVKLGLRKILVNL